jgi:FkbM family methyltransferase
MGLLYAVDNLLSGWRQRMHSLRPGPIGAWFRESGESQIWRDLPITPDDLCLDAGGYRGDWAAEILTRYGVPVMVFEAVPSFAHQIEERFQHNARVTVRTSALGAKNGKGEISLADDGSSVDGSGERVAIDVVDVGEIFAAHGSIGCMKLNIEGGEYDVLERMMELGLLDRVATYRIQFHVRPDADRRRKAIQEALARTHVSVLDYPFVWERWDRRRLA